jgi:hypothetical protein
MLMRWLIILERRIFECGQLLRRYSSLFIAKNGKMGSAEQGGIVKKNQIKPSNSLWRIN